MRGPAAAGSTRARLARSHLVPAAVRGVNASANFAGKCEVNASANFAGKCEVNASPNFAGKCRVAASAEFNVISYLRRGIYS